MADSGILTVVFEVKPEGEHLINRWYNEEHIADRLAIPGFNAVRRYRSLEGVLRHMTIWEVDDASLPFTPAYRSIPMNSWSDLIGPYRSRSTRTGWVELPTDIPRRPAQPGAGVTPGLRAVVMEIPPEHAADFHDWYGRDHVPDLMRRPEYRGIRRFRCLGDGDRYLALWDLSDARLHHRPGFRPAPPTEWTRRVAAYRRSVVRESWEEIPVNLPAPGRG